MPAPLKHDLPTGRPKGLIVMLIILLTILGSLGYAAKLPANLTSKKTDTPKVEGASTKTTPEEELTTTTNDEYVASEDVQEPDVPAADVPTITYEVTATVDGDTIKASVDGKIETLRLIGVDTPETKDPRKSVQCFGKQASDFTRASLLGKKVRLEADNTQNNRDKYGRLLRYVIMEDGTNFNLRLISEGYAYEYTYRIPYQYQTAFKQAQQSAATAQKGLWSPTSCSGKR